MPITIAPLAQSVEHWTCDWKFLRCTDPEFEGPLIKQFAFYSVHGVKKKERKKERKKINPEKRKNRQTDEHTHRHTDI